MDPGAKGGHAHESELSVQAEQRAGRITTVNQTESASEQAPLEAGEVTMENEATPCPSPSGEAVPLPGQPIETAERSLTASREHARSRGQSSSRPRSGMAAASMKQHSVAEQLAAFKRHKEQSNRRNFMKAYLYDSVVKSMLIILDECIKSRERFAVDRTRRFAKEFEQVRKLQQSEAEAFEQKLIFV